MAASPRRNSWRSARRSPGGRSTACSGPRSWASGCRAIGGRELDRARLAAILPEARQRELWPEDASPGPADLAGLDCRPPRPPRRRAAALPGAGDPAGSASNAWTVAAGRSASGAPLLADDPHLGFQAPILWYLARIDLADGRLLAGATSPGVPLMVIGRNADLAWGFTTTHSDTQDVFVERLAGPDAYETPDGPRPFAVRRGGDPGPRRRAGDHHGAGDPAWPGDLRPRRPAARPTGCWPSPWPTWRRPIPPRPGCWR